MPIGDTQSKSLKYHQGKFYSNHPEKYKIVYKTQSNYFGQPGYGHGLMKIISHTKILKLGGLHCSSHVINKQPLVNI